MADKKRILVADDDVAAHGAWRETLTAWGYKVAFAADGEQALEVISTFRPHVLLCDLRMPRKNGLELLSDIRELGLDIVSLIISGARDIADAVQAIKLGAYDYLTKPVDLGHLEILLNNLNAHLTLREENQQLRRHLINAGLLGPLIGHSMPMRRVMTLVEQVAPSSASVVITGASGTGKEVVARTIHELSPRRDAPFIAINCAALPEPLMESELFGHERGAFTGADRRREGCFELANGGTLFLDEVGEMRPELQVKLLRALEERKIRRIGGNAEVPVDVRVLAASNRDLEAAIREGKFREDLYYRLNVFVLELPSLRERASDIPSLVDLFLRQLEVPQGKIVAGIDAECLELMKSFSWPGNVRQLRNAIEHALIVTRGPNITAADLPADLREGRKAGPAFELQVGMSLEAIEREVVRRTLTMTGGNKSEAARILGVSVKTLYNWLRPTTAEDPATPPSNEDLGNT